MPAGATTLPARYYTDPALLSREMDRLFAQDVDSAPGAVEQVESPGQFFVRELARREHHRHAQRRRARVQAFYNVCRHRGTRLCTEAAGQFAGSIQCPYHAWTYDLDGRLIGAPHMDEVPHFRKADYPLHRVARGRVGRPHLPEPRRRAPRRSSSSSADLPAKFTQLADAGPPARPPHRLRREGELEADHPELQRVPALPEPAPGAQQAVALPERRERAAARRPTWAAAWTCGRAWRRCRWTAPARARSCRSSRGRASRRVYYYAIFPNMLLSLHPDYMMVHTLWPLAPDRTINICEWHFHPTELARPGFDAVRRDRVLGLTNRQDWHVCELSQAGISSRAYVPGPVLEPRRPALRVRPDDRRAPRSD